MIIRLEGTLDLHFAVEQTRSVLMTGGVAACPTESFYGLAVDAADERAIRKLFLLKQRDPRQPVLILIPSAEALQDYTTHIPDVGFALMSRFWPGGLTLILEASRRVSPLLTAGTGKIGIRLSSHPVPTALAGALGRPITGTSANPSGAPPSCRAEEVLAYFGQGIDLILDAGKTPGGIGSTVLDVTTDPPRILREGMISISALEEVIGPLAD